MLEFKLALFLAIMWPRLEHPDRGIIGASHTMENFETKTQEDGDSEDEALPQCMLLLNTKLAILK
jgi:hypothetical protein